MLDLGSTPAIDVTATDMLAQLAGERHRRRIRLAVAHAIGQVRDILQRAEEEAEALPMSFATIDDAIASFDSPATP